MAYLRTEAPVFREGESAEERIARLAGFAAQLRRELGYVLTHLGGGNMNGAGLAIDVTDGAGRALGRIGQSGGGVGLTAEGAGVAVSDGTVTLTCGSTALRLTGEGIEATADGGETWRSL